MPSLRSIRQREQHRESSGYAGWTESEPYDAFDRQTPRRGRRKAMSTLCRLEHFSTPDGYTGRAYLVRNDIPGEFSHVHPRRVMVASGTRAVYLGCHPDPMGNGSFVEVQLIDGELAGLCVQLFGPWGFAEIPSPAHVLRSAERLDSGPGASDREILWTEVRRDHS